MRGEKDLRTMKKGSTRSKIKKEFDTKSFKIYK